MYFYIQICHRISEEKLTSQRTISEIMLRNLSLIVTLLIGPSLFVQAHDIRGSARNPSSEVDFEKGCKNHYLEVCCEGICEKSPTIYTTKKEAQEKLQPCKTQCLDKGGTKCHIVFSSTGCTPDNTSGGNKKKPGNRSGGGNNRRPGNRSGGGDNKKPRNKKCGHGLISCRTYHSDFLRSNEACTTGDKVVSFDCDNGKKLCCTQSTSADFDDCGQYGHCVKSSSAVLYQE